MRAVKPLLLVVVGFAVVVLVVTFRGGPDAGSTAASANDAAATAPAAAAGLLDPNSPGGVFTTLDYETARTRAAANDRLFLVKGTATWCGPCKMMDRDTWPDPAVSAWMKDNALAYSLDVDRESSRARSLGVRSMPTLILFDGDRELGRIKGYRGPEQLLQWLRSMKQNAS